MVFRRTSWSFVVLEMRRTSSSGHKWWGYGERHGLVNRDEQNVYARVLEYHIAERAEEATEEEGEGEYGYGYG